MKKIYLILILILNSYASSSVEVSVIKPKVGDASITIEANGIVIPKNKRVLTAQTTGILQLFTHNNASVKQGELIAYVKDERRKKKLQLLKQKLLIQKRELQAQQYKLTDAKEMYTMGVGSKNIYLSEKLALEQLQELYNNTKTAYVTLQQEETNAHIIADENATLINLLPQNSYISYGMPLATLLTQNSIVKLFVDSQYIHQLKKGMEVEIYSSFGNTKGIITALLAKTSDNLSEVIVLPQMQLPQNLQITANIIVKNYHGTYIPKESVVLTQNIPTIYIIKDGVAHQFFIDIVKDMVDRVLIKDNLPKDTNIALKNAYMLHNNLEVSVK
jgi:multidrug efflux pump subunit AcrA (membrane-fusion protein)